MMRTPGRAATTGIAFAIAGALLSQPRFSLMDELQIHGGRALGRPPRARPLVAAGGMPLVRGVAAPLPSVPEPRPPIAFNRRKVMKISARNVLKGKVVAVDKGQTTAHVRIDIGNGKVVTASITNQAVDDLGLKAGEEAYAVIKASAVMVAVD
jgi:molybdopterin-binding protein